MRVRVRVRVSKRPCPKSGTTGKGGKLRKIRPAEHLKTRQTHTKHQTTSAQTHHTTTLDKSKYTANSQQNKHTTKKDKLSPKKVPFGGFKT